jgi:hypothetical protein
VSAGTKAPAPYRNDSKSGDTASADQDRSHLKKVFWPNLGVGRSVQVLEILQYSSGLNLTAALTLNQNPFFEIASKNLAGAASKQLARHKGGQADHSAISLI